MAAPGYSVVRADLSDAAHAAAWSSCTAAYALDPLAGGPEMIPPEVLARNVASLATWPTAVIFLAFEDATGAAAGMATCFRGWSTYAAAPLLNVHDFAVMEAHRRRGVGTALLRAVVDQARAERCAKVTLEMLPENATAQALYERLGFRFHLRFGELKLRAAGEA